MSTPIDDLQRAATDLSGSYECEVVLDNQLAVEEFEYLSAGGRDFGEINSRLQRDVGKALRSHIPSVLRGVEEPLQAIEAAGGAILTRLTDRIEHSGADVSMRPLSPRWIAFKANRGKSAAIGVFEGILRDAIRGGRVTVRRV